MPQPTKIPRPFADSGDKNTIPDSSGNIGFASWQEGFPQITSEPFAQGGVAPKRADFNGIFNALSAATLWYQQGGVYDYDNTTDYEVGNLAAVSGVVYICKTANGPGSSLHSPSSDTSETYWGRVYPQYGTFKALFFSQTSGNYTAPATGIYRITLKSGGGGGGGAQTDRYATGGAGGEGGTIVFYETLTKSTSYAYVIGAGGAAGANGATNTDATNGSDGGTSSIVIGGTTYSITGGGGGRRRFSNGRGGLGGGTKTPLVNTVALFAGQSGANGTYPTSGVTATGYTDTAVQGPGRSQQTTASTYGGGGNGGGPAAGDMSTILEPTAGGDGFIMIEYEG